ncbi:MAG: C10 family peptidase [Elusimicrobiota bacterium]
MQNNKIKRIIYILLILAAAAGNGFAEDVSFDDARYVAAVHSGLGYSQRLNSGAGYIPDYSVKEIKYLKHQDTGETLAYVAELDPKGFIVLAKDDSITPVIAYSFNNNFSYSEDQNNIMLYMLRQDMEKRLEAIPLFSEARKEENRKKWDDYLSRQDYLGTLRAVQQWPSNDDTGYLDTTWQQGPPYNELCPMDGALSSIAGCAATAMAQVVYYNQYPPSIQLTSGDAYTTLTKGINVSSFDTVNNRLNSISYVSTSDTLAAALSFACGVLLEMDYTADLSGAHLYSETFTIDLAYKDAEKLMGDATNFYIVLEENMKTERPALLAIYKGMSSGHAIVADGYRSNGEYHLNFGWGATSPDSMSECWYTLPSGMPDSYNTLYYGIVNITVPTGNPYNQYEESISYPNPFRVSSVNSVIITISDAIEGYVDKVSIYTLSGNLVREIDGENDYKVDWNGKNSSGNKCAPGLYFYVIKTTEKEVYRGKITVLD